MRGGAGGAGGAALGTGTPLLLRGGGRLGSSRAPLPIPRDLPACLRSRAGLLGAGDTRGAPRAPWLPLFAAGRWGSEPHTSHTATSMAKLSAVVHVIVQSGCGSWRWNAEGLKGNPRRGPRTVSYMRSSSSQASFSAARLRLSSTKGGAGSSGSQRRHRPPPVLTPAELLSSFPWLSFHLLDK